MQTSPIRKNCLEVSGGRLTYQADYEMPGLEMQISSHQPDQCLMGGGEVHYVSSCASGRITRIMLADICGLEEIVKRMSCELRGGLLRNINSIWQHRFVSEMSRRINAFAQQGGFATLSVATFFSPTRSFVMCNMGNPPPLLFRARERSWQVLHGETAPVVQGCEIVQGGETPDGVVDPGEYRHIKTKLEVDDIVVLYGNGFSQAKFPEGNMVAHQRLLDALQDSPHCHPKSRLNHLVGLILDHNESTEESTIIASQVTRSGVRLRDNLLAPLRLFRRPRDASRLM